MLDRILWCVDEYAEAYGLAVTSGVTPNDFVAHALQPVTGPVTAPKPLFKRFPGAVTPNGPNTQNRQYGHETTGSGSGVDSALQHTFGLGRL